MVDSDVDDSGDHDHDGSANFQSGDGSDDLVASIVVRVARRLIRRRARMEIYLGNL